MAESIDPEIKALGTVLQALEPLDAEAQDRVLDYALRRLGRALSRRPLRGSIADSPTLSSPREPGQTLRPSQVGTTDIRSLKQNKKPKSANEMAALVAYYLTELAPAEERQDTVSPSDIERYFKQAQYPLPKAPRNTLSNAAAAGYFDFAGRGQYRLNPVGYNLVVHRMPSESGSARSESAGGRAQVRRKRKATAKKKSVSKRKAR